MRYEFELFNQIAENQSNAFTFDAQDLAKYKAELFKKHPQCSKIIIANFQKSKKALKLLSRRDICILNPEIDNINNLQLSHFYDNIETLIGSSGLKALNISQVDIICYAIKRHLNGTTFYIKVPYDISKITSEEARYYYYNTILKDEVARIKKALTTQVHTLICQHDIENYIHVQQQALTTLCFHLLKRINAQAHSEIYKPAKAFSLQDTLNLAFIYLENIQQYFETDFLNYINKDIQIPYRSSLVKVYRISEKLTVVKNAFLNCTVDSSLQQIVYNYFLTLDVMPAESRISYKDLIYFNTFLSAFYDEIISNDNSISEKAFIETVYTFNFNSLAVFDYKVNQIKLGAAAFDDDDPQLVNYYYAYLKKINQRKSKLNISYKADRPSLKEMIKSWLDEEIAYVSRKQAANVLPRHTDLFTNSLEIKLKSGISVAQLSYFFKLQKDVGLIEHKNQRDIFRHIASNYYTSKVNVISEDSISTRFYNHTDSDMDSVRGLLIAMLNQIGKEKM